MTYIVLLRIAGVATVGVAWLLGLWAVALWRRKRSTPPGGGGLETLAATMRPCRPAGYCGTRRMPAPAPVRVVGVARIPGAMSPRGQWPLVPLRSDPSRDTVPVQMYDPPARRRNR